MIFAASSIESSISEALRFLTTIICASAPARSNALAVSYSQLVPGNTGINTLGTAALIDGNARLAALNS